MKHTTIRLAALTLCIILGAQDAAAWGPGARKAVAMAALQSIRRDFDDLFKAEESNYEADMLRGAEEGIRVIRDSVPLNTDEQTIAAVTHEIRLLRTAREYGTGSYFAYRMGVLSALVSGVVLPYGIPFSESQREIRDKIDADIDAHVDRYSYAGRLTALVYIRSANQYFSEKRTFYESDAKFMADDYTRGEGYQGFLVEAGQAYFGRAVDSVTDAWFTVIRGRVGGSDVALSPSIMAWYLVDNIGYLVDVKKNLFHASKAYEVFEKVNPNIMEAYERIGDHFYAFDIEESQERGVREWRKSLRDPGPHRQRVSNKLSTHFVVTGEGLFRRASGPNARDNDLQDALRAFQRALEFVRTNDVAADRITETTIAITERRAAYEMQQSLIDNAMTVLQEAEKARLDLDYGNGIFAYNQALSLIEGVDTQFKDLQLTAKSETSRIKKALRDIINEVLDRANNYIDEGNVAVEENRFDEAINAYNIVEPTVDVIPAARGSTHAQAKQDLIELAQSKIADVEIAKRRYKEELARPPESTPGVRAGASAAPAAPGAARPGGARPGGPGGMGPGRRP